MIRPFLIGALLLNAVATAAAQNLRLGEVRAAAESIVGADIHRDATYLAADAQGGRATPSPGFDSAAAYIIRSLRQLGVTPAGDSGTYMQHYTVTRSVLDTARTHAYVAERPLAYGSDFLVATFLTLGRREGGIVYVGDFLTRTRQQTADPYVGLDVRGKWLLVQATGEMAGGISRDIARAVDARARGALGILVIPSAATLTSWSALRARPLSARDLDPAHGVAYAQYPLPQVVLARQVVEWLLDGERLSAALALTPDSVSRLQRPFELGAGKRFRLQLIGEATSFRAYNVVAMIEGSDPQLRREYITVASHLDGAVGRGVQGADTIFNAADDNASGSAGNMAIARALMRAPRPKRSIVLIWDSGEETGLWGTRHLAHSPMSQQIVAHFNIDMIGRTKEPGSNRLGEDELSGPGEVFLAGPRVLSTHMDSIVTRAAREFNYIKYDRRFDVGDASFFYPRTDAAPYLERGIPYVEFFTGLHGDYHRPGDDPAKLDAVKMEAVTRAAFVTLWMLADDPIRPSIDKPLPPHIPQLRSSVPQERPQPLFVIDGILVAGDFPIDAAVGDELQIEAIEVIRGPRAVTQFGERAQHGAVLITTRETPTDTLPLARVQRARALLQRLNEIDPAPAASDRPPVFVDPPPSDGRRAIHVVDGVVVSSEDALNLTNIASIEIIRGEAAARLYGTRAAGGVIAITTRARTPADSAAGASHGRLRAAPLSARRTAA